MGKKKRERIDMTDEFEDQTCDGPWEMEGETYKKITETLSHSDGECTTVIVQRESDEKFFSFSWVYTYSQNYSMDDELYEVFPKTITTTTYE